MPLAEPMQTALLFGILGLLIGSFLNVVIHRLPRGLSVVSPPSACPACGRRVRALENIPVLSFLLLGGRCRGCAGRIGWRYPVVEALTGLLTAFSALQLGWGPQLLPGLLLLWALLALTFIDLDTQLLPDAITKPGMLLGLLLNTGVWYGLGQPLFASPLSSLLGLLLGYGSLWLLAMAYLKLTGKHGMGFGDLKLLGMLGAWLGWSAVPMILFIAALTGGLVGIALLAAGRGRHYAIPFGPYLALGGWLMLLWPQQIIHGYFSLLGG